MHPLHDDEAQPAGRPIQAPQSQVLPVGLPRWSGAAATFERTVTPEDEPRPDEGVRRPKQVPSDASPLTEADWSSFEQAQAREAAEESQRIEELLASEPTLLHIPALLLHPLALAALIGLAGLLGLFLFAHITSTLASLASLPAWLQYAGWVGLGLLAAGVLFAVGRFTVFYFRLNANRPVRLKSLEQVTQRTHLRWLVHEKKSDAREQLARYLQTYPIGTIKDRVALGALGLNEETLKQLDATRSDLIDSNQFASTEDWFTAFQTRFQASLDTAATGMVAYFARRVAIMTAVSPNTLIDTLLTMYCSFLMLADLCRIYNLRVGRVGTAVLLARVFFNSYVAGQLNEFESVTEAGIEGLVSESGLHFGSLAVDAAVGKVVGKLGSRATSGMLNYFMLKRLGRYATRLLQPVHGTTP